MVAAPSPRTMGAARGPAVALRDGGGAVAAAVAAALCLAVMTSGVGGGAFMLVRLADGTAVVYDSRETAPLAASKVSRQRHCPPRLHRRNLPATCPERTSIFPSRTCHNVAVDQPVHRRQFLLGNSQ